MLKYDAPLYILSTRLAVAEQLERLFGKAVWRTRPAVSTS
jgi:hypothetical protein